MGSDLCTDYRSGGLVFMAVLTVALYQQAREGATRVFQLEGLEYSMSHSFISCTHVLLKWCTMTFRLCMQDVHKTCES